MQNNIILNNGIRLLHVKAAGDVAYCGAIINAGTRDEMPSESGYAHLVEHLLFKGTAKYNSKQIISRIENVGGEINAFTTKEDTTVYAAFMTRYLERTLSLIADMVFNSQFSQKEIDKEVDVVIEEIDSYIDNPAEKIFDDFEELIFSGNPLGRNILGDKKTLKKVTQSKIAAFHKRTYTPDHVVFFVYGNYSKERVQKLADKLLSVIPAVKRDYVNEPLAEYVPVNKSIKKGTQQQHIVIGNRSYSLSSKKRYAFALLDSIIGGPFMSSILNMRLRESEGLVYEVDSSCAIYTDTANWNIYLGCDASNSDKALSIIMDELHRLATENISDKELKLAKTRYLSFMTIRGENRENWILGVAKQYLRRGYVPSKKEVEEKINAITANDLRCCAAEIFNPTQLTVLTYK